MRLMSKGLNYSAVFVKDKEGGYVAFVPSLLGCHSQGETLAQAKVNIIEATELYLETLLEDHEKIPIEGKVSQQQIQVTNPALS